MASGKTWNRRLAVAGGAALAAGGYLALRRPSGSVHHKIADAHTFLRGNAAEPQTLDPSLATGFQDTFIIIDLMEGLVALDAHAKPIPGVASHWQTSADGLTWRFFLREAQWSDGAPVTAEDFVFAWRRILDPATPAGYAYFLYALENAVAVNGGKLPLTALGVRALDAHTLEVRLEHPAAYLPQMLTHQAMMPLPRHVVAAKGKDWSKPGNHVGNGPFTLKQWIPNDHVEVVKNPRYREADQVTLKRVLYFPTDDYGAALQRFRAGELDCQDKLPAQQIDWIKANIPAAVDPVPQFILDFICVNHTRKPFNDVRVRTALSLAINREVIAGRIWRTGEVPAYAVVPPGMAHYPGGTGLYFKSEPYAARIEQARALMREAGFSENKPLRTNYVIRSTAPGTYRAGAAAIQQMLAQVYIDVTILPADFPIFIATTQNHDFDVAQCGWVADFDDASSFLDLFQTGGGNNWGVYSNPAFDAMLKAAQNDPDPVSRGRKLAAAEAIVLKDQAVMPLFFWVNPNLCWPYVKGYHANPLDLHPSRWVTIDQPARIKQFT
jgi:oligopeptide transport system substrate-binding protein